MKYLHTALVTACAVGLPLLSSGASVQSSDPSEHDHPDVVVEDTGSRTFRRTIWADSTRVAQSGGVSTTPDDQILVELAPKDTAAANLFDLNGRTLVFTPDGHGGYSRSVRSVAWEDNIGQAVADGAEVQLQSFMFDFANQRWGSFFVSRHGLITFGERPTYSYYWDSENRFDTMMEIAGKFVTTPMISALYKPMLGGRSDHYGATQHVASSPEQVVVTWKTTEPDYYVHGLPPATPSRFQLVLKADGRIAFNYRDISLRDGIVGLFPDDGIVKGDLIASIADASHLELPGQLDLLEVAVYESNTDAVIVEFTARDAITGPPAGTRYSYRLYFDTDEPYWNRYGDGSDLDFMWSIDLRANGTSRTRGGKLLPRQNNKRIALLADTKDLAGISATVIADAAQFNDQHGFVQGNNSSPLYIELPVADHATDLSQSDSRFTDRQSEVFHYPSPPDLGAIACRVIDVLGDEFDLFVFHNEFRVDSQESGTPWNGQRSDVKGIGVEHRNRTPPCGSTRLKGHWGRPVWMQSDHVVDGRRDEERHYDRGLLLFAHELTHAWTAHLSYLRDGSREPLFGQYCQCHWRTDLHMPAAFPWHEEDPGPRSLMGGRYWRDNGDGTFTPLDGYWGGGHSWLDLYAMGLADASEVPDMFILRNLRSVNEDDGRGPHTGDKEVVTIEQVVAAEGPREPTAAESQKTFNAGFVYLVEPGKRPAPDLLRLHAEYRDKVIEHWSHITGGRSQMTTTVPDGPDDGGPTSPTEPGRTAPPTLDLTCHGYDEGATRAYNCIPEPSQQRFMGTFVPAVGSACDRGSIAEFPPGRIVFQIRCRDGSPGQSAAWSYAGRGPASFVTPAGTSRVRIRTSFPGSSVRLSVWCRAPQEQLVVNELLGAAWGNDGTSGIYGMAGCREVAVDTAREHLQWRFAQELAATALTPPRSWERVSGAGGDLSAEALQDLATATELERRWRRPGRSWMHPRPSASTRGAASTADADGGELRTASGPDDGTDALDWAPFRATTRTVPLTLDLSCHGYDEGATRAYNCIPEPSQQRHMRTFVPAVGSACDQGSIAEFPPGRIVFQIRCRDAGGGQSAAWSHSGLGPTFFEKPTDTPRVWVRTSFSGSSVGLSAWCRAPEEHLVVNELLGRSWGNNGTEGLYDLAGCREVEVDTGQEEDVRWSFTEELAATALTPPRSWEQASDTGMALPPEARQDLATAAELERLWLRPGR